MTNLIKIPLKPIKIKLKISPDLTIFKNEEE
jgi:hypothetical protein